MAAGLFIAPVDGMNRIVVACVFGAVLGVACNSDSAATVRQYTYSKDFHYYDEKQVNSSMHRISKAARELNALLKQQELTPEQQAEVVRLLGEMERGARELKSADPASNHPRITDNVDQFIRDIETARASAQRTPPNYYLAGSITGSCFYCHSPTGIP
ncbi:MAG: hypothetical protein AB2A00_33255 [Myxococcota bacterium]